MSETKFKIDSARIVAEKIIQKLSPFCLKIEIAGSIRREKRMVKDVEIVLVPKTTKTGLFLDTEERDADIVKILSDWKRQNESLEKETKGDPKAGKYLKLYYGDYPIDLFIANPRNWGYIFALRTGSSNYNQTILKYTKRHGYTAQDGHIWDNNRNIIEVPTEEGFFNLIQLEMLEPKNRK